MTFEGICLDKVFQLEVFYPWALWREAVSAPRINFQFKTNYFSPTNPILDLLDLSLISINQNLLKERRMWQKHCSYCNRSIFRVTLRLLGQILLKQRRVNQLKRLIFKLLPKNTIFLVILVISYSWCYEIFSLFIKDLSHIIMTTRLHFIKKKQLSFLMINTLKDTWFTW